MAGKRNIFAAFLSKSNAQEKQTDEAKSDEQKPVEQKPAEEESVEEKPLEEESVEDKSIEDAPVEDATDGVESATAGSVKEEVDGAIEEERLSDGDSVSDQGVSIDGVDGHDEATESLGEQDSKDARIAQLEKTVAENQERIKELEENIAQWSDNLTVVKESYEALKASLAEVEQERDRLDGIRLSLERANARLVEQNNLLMGNLDEADRDAEDVEGEEAAAKVKYEVLYTPPNPEMHEAIEDSSFFEGGEQMKAREFHMPGSSLFRR